MEEGMLGWEGVYVGVGIWVRRDELVVIIDVFVIL